MLQKAIELADMGFKIFPIAPNTKIPTLNNFPELATSDHEQLKKWWIDPVLGLEQPYNIGISTSSFGNDGEALLVIDVDNKDGKDGDGEIARLEMLDYDFPPTLSQLTPTGGRHLIYKVKTAVKQGTSVLAPGLDIRSRGGYIVGSGSVLNGKEYSFYGKEKEIKVAKKWVIEKCETIKIVEKLSDNKSNVKGISSGRANAKAGEYLRVSAPLAIEGENGDQKTFSVICRIKDFGVSEKDCFQLLCDFWNDRCSPPWDADALETKIRNAYAYGTKAIGVDAIENEFAEEIAENKQEKGEHPFDKINKEYAFVTTGGSHCVLYETKDEENQFKIERLAENTFHKKLASRVMMSGSKVQQTTRLWMNSPNRRSYKGICFSPGKEASLGYYNLWRGFTYEPLGKDEKPTKEMQESLEAFLEHALQNVCEGQHDLFHWLMTFFAHLIQKPYEKPLVALVFRGQKGVGKNALVERVGSLLGPHFRVANDRRYLVGNFNSHFENNLFFVLDEAFWSGDTQAEGILKGLTTGKHHFIEHKGYEAHTVLNISRIAIIGNEEWLVPASLDERRFAVFDVGNGHKQNTKFFKDMRIKMENGGYRLLLTYLLNYDISKYDVNIAPMTKGLHDQKLASLTPFQDWLYDCLKDGSIIGSDAGWPKHLPKDTMRNSFIAHTQRKNVRGRYLTDSAFGKMLKHYMPTITSTRLRDNGDRAWYYEMPTLETARKTWEEKIGHAETWGD